MHEAMSFTCVPSVLEQNDSTEQAFVEALQYIPAVGVQSVLPHWQSVPAALAAVPSVLTQIAVGRAEHMFNDDLQYIPTINPSPTPLDIGVDVQVTVPHLHAGSSLSCDPSLCVHEGNKQHQPQ